MNKRILLMIIAAYTIMILVSTVLSYYLGNVVLDLPKPYTALLAGSLALAITVGTVIGIWVSRRK